MPSMGRQVHSDWDSRCVMWCDVIRDDMIWCTDDAWMHSPHVLLWRPHCLPRGACVLCCIVLYGIVWYCIVFYCIVLYCIALYYRSVGLWAHTHVCMQGGIGRPEVMDVGIVGIIEDIISERDQVPSTHCSLFIGWLCHWLIVLLVNCVISRFFLHRTALATARR